MDHDAIKIRNKIYDDFHKVNRDLIGFGNDLKSLMEICIDFEKRWSIDIGTSTFRFSFDEDMENLFQVLKENIMQEVKRVVVVGKSSCGKSAFINALVAESILPITSRQHFVEIRPSATTRNYAVINKMKIELTKKEELEVAFWKLSQRGNLKATIFYDRTKCQFINENIFITETIGLENLKLMNEFIRENHSDIDLVIIIVDARKGISEIEKSFISNHRNELCNSTVFIVYSFWDFVPILDHNRMKIDCLMAAAQILRCEPSGDHLRAESNIFFISAPERMSLENSNPQWNDRNDNFTNLISQMKRMISVNTFNRVFNRQWNQQLNELYCVLENKFRKCQFSVAQMRVELTSKLRPTLASLTNFNALINGKIKEQFSIAFEDLLKRGLEALNNQTQINNLDQRLKRLVEEVVDNCLKELKLKILELIPKDLGGGRLHSFRKSILEQLYFPFYFDLSSEINSFDISVLRTNLEEISKCIKVGKRVIIGLTTVVGALGFATGGLAFALAGFVPVTAVVGSAVSQVVHGAFSGAVADGTVGGAITGRATCDGTSSGIANLVKKPIQYTYMKNEQNIRAKWNSFESVVSNTYENFVGNIALNITKLLAPIEDRLLRLQNNLNNTKEELKVLENYSLIH